MFKLVRLISLSPRFLLTVGPRARSRSCVLHVLQRCDGLMIILRNDGGDPPHVRAPLRKSALSFQRIQGP
jgi:hypothetical protein